MTDDCDFIYIGTNEDDKGAETWKSPALSIEEGITITTFHGCTLINNGYICAFPQKLCKYVEELQELTEYLGEKITQPHHTHE